MCDHCHFETLNFWKKNKSIVRLFVQSESPTERIKLLAKPALIKLIECASTNYLKKNILLDNFDKFLLQTRKSIIEELAKGRRQTVLSISRNKPKLVKRILTAFSKSIKSNFYHECTKGKSTRLPIASRK